MDPNIDPSISLTENNSFFLIKKLIFEIIL
jgi:hypothetical protein